MSEAEKPTLEEALKYFGDFKDNRDSGISLLSTKYSAVVVEAARRYAAIEKAVKAGTHALVPVEPTDDMRVAGGAGIIQASHNLQVAYYAWRAMVEAHGTDSLIDGGEQNGH